MATLAESLVSASSRRLMLRKRGDISIREQQHQGRTFYVVKDPVGLGYYRLREEEYAVLQMLDGTTSLEQIKERFEKQFAPQQITLKQLQWFIGQLHRNGLILSHVPGQGEQLNKRRGEKFKQEVWGKITNFMSLRFKGFDPERLLTWMDRWLGWIYSPWCISLCILLMLSAATLVTVQFETFQAKLPAFHEFFQAKYAVLLMVALGVTKVLHEFGHGLTCKHFGGECHELGVMFLVFTPCLYCNVSDSWMLPNKWHRIYIGAGGMFVELVLASIATFVWWFSQPGVINYLALSTMFVCSVSTIIFNGNPLLRYDGYYILSDLVEIPNLWQKSRSVLNRTLGQWCLGLQFPPDPFLPEKNKALFAGYAVASSIYRWIVMFSILWFLHEVFKPYRLQILGQLLAVISIVSLVVMPTIQVVKFFWIPGRVGQVKLLRALVSFGLLCAIVLFAFTFPLPRRVFTTLVIEPRDAHSVYVTVPGRLDAVQVQPGQAVEAGDPLAELSSIDLDLEIAELRRKLDRQQILLDGLNRRRVREPEVASQIPHSQATLKDMQTRLDQKLTEREKLKLKAPLAGTILPARQVPAPEDSKQLRSWIGTPLDLPNLGSELQTGTVLCQIGNPQQLQATLIIDQGDIEFVQQGQNVSIVLEPLQQETFRGKISEISESEMEVAPEAVSEKAGGDLQTSTNKGGGYEKPLSTSYQAQVPLEVNDPRLCTGLRGEAKIEAGTTTLWQICWRYLRQTFSFS